MNKNSETRRPVGRPRKEPAAGERYPVTARLTADLRAQMELEADRNGRSLAQEAEVRIRDSFAEFMPARPGLRTIIRAAALAAAQVERATGKDCESDYLTAVAVQSAISQVLSIMLAGPQTEAQRLAGEDALDRIDRGTMDPALRAEADEADEQIDTAVEIGRKAGKRATK